MHLILVKLCTTKYVAVHSHSRWVFKHFSCGFESKSREVWLIMRKSEEYEEYDRKKCPLSRYTYYTYYNDR